MACDVCGGDGRVASSRAGLPTGAGAGRDARARGRRAGGDRRRPADPLSGRGHAGERGGPPGDLYVLVRVREDERFVRDGDDLVTVLDVPAPLAALGTTLEVPTLDGAAEVEVPAGTQPGEVLTLRGKGMPRCAAGAPATCAWWSTS